MGRNRIQDWVSRARPDRESLGSPREEFGFDSESVGSHFRFLSVDVS